jgi:KR domain
MHCRSLQARQQVQYGLQWQVGHTVQQAAALAASGAMVASLVHCLRLRQQRASAEAPVVILAAAQLLQHLQRQDAQRTEQETKLLVCAEAHDSVAGSSRMAAAAAAAAALLGVAASEAPDRGFSVVQTSPQQATPGPAAASDAHGVMLSAGAVLLPRLLPAFWNAAGAASAGGAAGTEVQLEAQPASWRQVAISGGLGGLGLLAAAWLAWQGAQHIVLLGRTGR